MSKLKKSIGLPIRITIAITFLIVSSSCEKEQKISSLVNTEWQFVRSMDIHTGESSTYFGGDEPYRLAFDTETTFSLSPSCNYSGGDYEVEGNRISFTRIGPGTSMGCLKNPSDEWESFFLNRLSASHSYTATGSSLILSSDGHRMHFKRTQ